MDWDNFEKMDPHLLVGVINTNLRNQHESLEDLCRTHDIEQERLIEKLATGGYQYIPEGKRFG